MPHFVKRNPAAPPGCFAAEAAGLCWLTVPGGVRTVPVLAVDEHSLTLQRLHTVAPTPAAARDFGARLAITHDAGADAFGCPPAGWTGPGFFGPLSAPMPMSLTGHDRWGSFYAHERLAPMLDRCAHRLPAAVCRVVEQVIDRCADGWFDDDDHPVRLHGDLWSGNVLWTPDGVVLIDPAAHGGHRETDLAMLALFGCPHLDDILDAYQQVRPLRPGWRDRIPLHQLYPLLAHVALFGASYVGPTTLAAASARRLFS
ncbi:fructosamine kinase family protein [uncultured Mycolicibacterium sp.]|uniref:fructosamine kinase family protein n=1 Tax=uncultured Mycolicibacterium sp. TaxID=2320817 RepID=UPI00260ECF55|nr:fructosamine kinase family protein [uncultured Mycolicibacterium sp.]